MPELPEVETIYRELKHHLHSQCIKEVIVRERRFRSLIDPNFEALLQGQTFASFKRRAKYIQIDLLPCSLSLIFHLGMSGRLIILPSQADLIPFQKHEHVVFRFISGIELRFSDPRRFGSLRLTPTPEYIFQHLGQEPLSQECTGEYLYTIFKNRNIPIKSALLNQKFIVGLGNIYICEALHQAGIHPKRNAKEITLQEYDRLMFFIKSILSHAIQAGGSTLKDHKRTDGSVGHFQSQFNVYNKKGSLCNKCHQAFIEIFKQSNRSSYFCPKCQNI